MADPRTQLLSFPLTLGMDNVSHPEAVQPVGARPRVVSSRNTRLSKLAGCVSKAPGTTSIASGLTGAAGGVVPVGGSRDSTLLARRALEANQRSAGDGIETLCSAGDRTEPQNAYYPAQVEGAGVLGGSDGARWNASCAHADGWTYFVTLRRAGSNTGVYLNVMSDDGTEVVSGDFLFNLAAAADTDENFAAITTHGSTVVLWFAADGAASLGACTVSINPTTFVITLGSAANIYSPTGGCRGPKQIQVASDPTDSTAAFVAIQHSATAANVAVLRVNVPALTVAASVSLAANTYDWVGIAYKSGEGLMVATSAAGFQINIWELNTVSLSTIWTLTSILDDGQPSLGFQTYDGDTYRVLAVSRIETAAMSTHVAWFTSAGSVFVGTCILKQQTQVGHMVTLRNDDSTFDALITTQTCYSPSLPEDSYQPTDDFFYPDPSIEVYRTMPTVGLAGATEIAAYCVARVGVELCIRYPGAVNLGYRVFLASSTSCVDIDSTMLLTYLQETSLEGSFSDGYVVRYVKLDFSPVQPRFALSAEGTAVIAGGLPASWDGCEVTELSPMRKPKITGVATGGGAGIPLPAGTYQFAVVIYWKDAGGNIHRSPPSNVVSLTDGANPVDPIVTVYLPESYRNILSRPGYQVTLYISETDGVTPYATSKWTFVAPTVTFATESVAVTQWPTAVVDGFHPAIYTDEAPDQEIAAYCPGACLDAEVVADRLWLLDAERPTIWWFSKPKVALLSFEMNSGLYVETPSSAGAGVALSSWNGNPLFLTERGIWTCAGEGPDALSNPPFFSAAAQVSDVACTQRNSVVRSPAGVLFVSNDRFARFNGQLTEYPEIDATAYGDVVGTAVFRKQQEVCFFLSEGYVYVFNWLSDAWTLWDQDVTGMVSITGCAQRADGKVVLVNATSVRLMDPDTVSTVAQVSIVTGHVQLGDKQDNNMLENYIVHAMRGGSHGLTVASIPDYGFATNTKAVPAASITAAINSQFAYDVCGEPPEQSSRAVQLAFTETSAAGEGFQPISCTLELIKKPGRASRHLPESARV